MLAPQHGGWAAGGKRQQTACPQCLSCSVHRRLLTLPVCAGPEFSLHSSDPVKPSDSWRRHSLGLGRWSGAGRDSSHLQTLADRFVSAYMEEVLIELPTQLSPASVLWCHPLGALGSYSITPLSHIFNFSAGFSLQASCSQLAWGKPLLWPLSSSSSCLSLMPS